MTHMSIEISTAQLHIFTSFNEEYKKEAWLIVNAFSSLGYLARWRNWPVVCVVRSFWWRSLTSSTNDSPQTLSKPRTLHGTYNYCHLTHLLGKSYLKQRGGITAGWVLPWGLWQHQAKDSQCWVLRPRRWSSTSSRKSLPPSMQICGQAGMRAPIWNTKRIYIKVAMKTNVSP